VPLSEAVEYGGDVGLGVVDVELCGLGYSVDNGGTLATGIAAKEQKVFSDHRNARSSRSARLLSIKSRPSSR
jgi:hypothetical protein